MSRQLPIWNGVSPSACKAGLLGENILDSGFSCDIDVHVSAGRYICGEETALMNALEGMSGQSTVETTVSRRERTLGRPDGG